MTVHADSLLIPPGMRSPCGRLRMVRICRVESDGALASPYRGTVWTSPVIRAASWSDSSAISGQCGLHGVWDRWPGIGPAEKHTAVIHVLADGRAVVSETAARVERMSVQEIVLHPGARDAMLAAVRARYPEVPVRRARRSRARTVTLSPDGIVVVRRYRAGRRHGRWEVRHADGTMIVEHFRAGRRHGRWEIRGPDGRAVIGHYRAGRQHGRWEVRHANGAVVVERWHNGQQVS